MRRLLLSLLGAAALAWTACSGSHEREGPDAEVDADAGADAGAGRDADGGAGVASDTGEACEWETFPEGGFRGTELSIETESPACDESCLVYHLEGDPRADCTAGCSDPAEVERRVFCTCRCDGPTGEEPFCECPSGFRCDPLFDGALAPPSVRGSYCVRDGL